MAKTIDQDAAKVAHDISNIATRAIGPEAEDEWCAKATAIAKAALLAVARDQRERTFDEAIEILDTLPERISRRGVKKGSDANGWYNAISKGIAALQTAKAASTLEGE